MASYLTLLLIRHGESLGNVEGRLEGQMSTALSARGRWQTQQLAAYFKDQLKDQAPPTHIYSSPLQRAVETARPLAAVTGCPLQLAPQIQELHQGIFQGLTWSEANQRYSRLCKQLVATLDYQPVPAAETLAAAHQRAVSWYRTVGQRHQPGDVVWMVTHGGFMQQLIGVILGCDRTWQIPIRNTALFEFRLLNLSLTEENQYNPEHWKIEKFNEVPHLEGKT
ncbi:histidine phosphatase family protein [Leptolyngbya cf. ectocarpi LEGE 11479]|uniref:Histidine phosphatase family protein n=1 Tax=Leptolyngbya cf. ectocarpi LEGE 11479 TaxID=1828722 RepID=A0A928ZY99_LEPEC|nr:histidine phosphatase family protein [Leptolyngbya ectocarpi]MBE9069603.1 histidine phosphatase family protein [Leptolyngbya cf. ectocarpi LEGE 11479]